MNHLDNTTLIKSKRHATFEADLKIKGYFVLSKREERSKTEIRHGSTRPFAMLVPALYLSNLNSSLGL